MKLFNLDSPLIQFLSKMADLMWVNILTLILCLPIVTAGAALTAMHYVCLKIVRDEECYITKSFFHSFKENFLQSTGLWLIMLFIAGVLGTDLYLMYLQAIQVPAVIRIVIIAITVFAVLIGLMVFPIQAKFTNPIRGTLKNALIVTMLQFPKVLLMLVLYLLPFVLAYFFLQIFPVVVLLGLSLPAFVSAMLYNKIFKKMEDRYYEAHPEANDPGAEDEHIFSDTPLIPEDRTGAEK
ncbi:MAG: YesL family protein [Lachnospiraceae bacterium]|nr:YesL family protein [Lachnospiraceae bacterium]MCR5478217.1 YesL family protein [Lachnospiraceae bacterium]